MNRANAESPTRRGQPRPPASPPGRERMRRWDIEARGGRFGAQEAEPLGPLTNLVDVMLVFVCGLMVSLSLHHDVFGRGSAKAGQPRTLPVEQGQPLPQLPARADGQGGPGLTPVGQVYRDPKTGKLLLVEGGGG